ncbi:MAG: glycosyltransferase family 39 protein [Capsulimonadales bacterium]|nr:glycosyltransferase family 39 protein [Capsulimonadales bacterium]
MFSSAFGRRSLLTGILLLAAFLRFWNLMQNGFGNPYYAAAVRSMRGDLTRFLFASYDPGGFLSVDKPPLALWIQTLSGLAFGYRGWALLLPQAVAGLLAVALLYRSVRQDFGTPAGLCAAFFLAISPLTVATDRINLPDSLLTLILIVAAGTLLRAIRTGETLPLFLCAGCLGLGFLTKMWEALVPAPIFAAAYSAWANVPLPVRWRRLAGASILLVALVVVWPCLIDAVPADRRPYVGGSRNNSAFDLIFLYNGWERLTGGKEQLGTALLREGGALAELGATPGFWAGPPGPFRLFSRALGPQILWFLGGAAFLPILLLRRTQPFSRERQAAIGVWGGWFLAFAAVFSVAGGTVHPYYLTVIAPSVAALAGIALGLAWEARDSDRSALPTVLGMTALFQAFLLRDYAMAYPVLLVGPVGGLFFGAGTLWKRGRTAFLALCLLFLSFCPLYWSWTAAAVPGNGLTPSTGPEVAAGAWQYPPPTMPPEFTEGVVRFLADNRRGERFVVATGSVYNASPIIIETGLPVMAMGGFLGGDPILTPETLAGYVNRGEVRFLLLTPTDGLPGNTYLSPLAEWARDHCGPVPPEYWMRYRAGYGMEWMTLYDCSVGRGNPPAALPN